MELATAVEILAPPETVWSVMYQVEAWPEWTASITEVRRLDDGPLSVGSRVRIRQPRLPPALWQVSELVSGRRFTWVSRAPGILVSGQHEVEPWSGGSRATLRLTYAGLFGPLLGRLTAGISRRYLDMEAAGLKARSELQAASASPRDRVGHRPQGGG